MVKLDVPISAQALAIAAGTVAAVAPLSNTLIPAWATRFQTLFREYCIVGASLEVRQINATTLPQGVACAFIDEDSAAAPTAATTLNRARLDMGIVSSPVDRVYRITWKPLDYLDLDWVDGATAFIPAWFKFYTDSANFGTAATTSCQFMLTGTLALCFRGYV
jgi:hypothetical protein